MNRPSANNGYGIGSNAEGIFDFLLHSIDQRIAGSQRRFLKYQDDPASFAEDVLGETLTDDTKALMESVRDNPVTIAKSANATGKTFVAARIATWWYKCHTDADCQVYTGAAPPESNLKKLLWGEIGSIVENHTDLFKADTTTNLHITREAQSFITGAIAGQK